MVYTLVQNFSSTATLEEFDADAFKSSYAILMEVPEDTVTVRAYAASIIIETEVEYATEAEANAGVQKLTTMTPAEQSNALGIPVEPIGSPEVRAEATATPEKEGSNMPMLIAIAVVVVLVLVCLYCFLCGRLSTKRTKKKPGQPGQPVTDTGKSKKNKFSVVELETGGAQPPPPMPPPQQDSSFLVDESDIKPDAGALRAAEAAAAAIAAKQATAGGAKPPPGKPPSAPRPPPAKPPPGKPPAGNISTPSNANTSMVEIDLD